MTTCSFFRASGFGSRADGRKIKGSTFEPRHDTAKRASLGLIGAVKSTSPSLKATPTSSPACGGAILRAGDAKQSPLKSVQPDRARLRPHHRTRKPRLRRHAHRGPRHYRDFKQWFLYQIQRPQTTLSFRPPRPAPQPMAAGAQGGRPKPFAKAVTGHPLSPRISPSLIGCAMRMMRMSGQGVRHERVPHLRRRLMCEPVILPCEP